MPLLAIARASSNTFTTYFSYTNDPGGTFQERTRTQRDKAFDRNALEKLPRRKTPRPIGLT